MNRTDLRFPKSALALRDDVNELGTLLGNILREQGGDDFFARVESARVAAIGRRQGRREDEERLAALCSGGDAAAANELARAFGAYFYAVNLAEQVHRIRRSRWHQRPDSPPQPDGLETTLNGLKAAGLDLAAVRALLESLEVEPVFTAHPTQATRRSLLEKHQRIARALVNRMNPSLTPPEERVILERIRAELTAAWQTEEHSQQAPSVVDEIGNLMFYLTDIIYRVVPPFYENLHIALERVYGARAKDVTLPSLLRFSSWIGGDMDGNPNVSADTLRAALDLHRSLILCRYRAELDDLYSRLSQSASRIGFDDAVLEANRRYQRSIGADMAPMPSRYRSMPYRVLLKFIETRLRDTENGGPHAYGQAQDLVTDLALIAASLAHNKGEHAGLFPLRRLIVRVQTFGFHLAALDVRQDALVHRRVIGRALDIDDWLERSAHARTDRLVQALAGDEAPIRLLDEEGRHTLETFRAIADIRKRYGPAATGPYIISMAQDTDDILSVLLLARWAGLVNEDGTVPLDICPLFETVSDLEHGPDIVGRLMEEPIYRRHVEARSRRQMVMVGYSDSMKDGGLAASRWAVQRAQQRLVAVAGSADVALTIFHGRGGTVSRGGGKTHRGVLAAPHGAVQGRLRATEQGEIIDAKYGMRGIAARSLEQTVGAVMQATALPRGPSQTPDAWHNVMGVVARESRRVYRDLVYDDDRFIDYFRRATPIDVIERMAIGSRPPSRRAKAGIRDLRAIPWVFAWTQNRTILTGWFGLGSGLRAAAEESGEDELRSMLAEWPFFASLLDDAEMVLAKADMDIAARYNELAEPATRVLWPRIRDEYRLSVDMVLRLKETDVLLEKDSTLQRSIQLRNPYVDPLSLLQIDLLGRWREAGRPDDDMLEALFATIKGIAQGLQNTG